MKPSSQQRIDAFFKLIAPWRQAYHGASLYYLARQDGDKLSIVFARIYLDVAPAILIPEPFRAGEFQAGQWDISGAGIPLEHLLESLLSASGCVIEGHGRLHLAAANDGAMAVQEPAVLLPEASEPANRQVRIDILGGSSDDLAPQPEVDWVLKAGEVPYDNMRELCADYGLDAMIGPQCRLEVLAQAPVQVFAGSTVVGGNAILGLWTAKALDKGSLKLGYRIMLKGKVVRRGAVTGGQLEWIEAGIAMVGKVVIEVPEGASVQCITSYEDCAHHQLWISDPKTGGNDTTTAKTDPA
jgi:hypothetical protein